MSSAKAVVLLAAAALVPGCGSDPTVTPSVDSAPPAIDSAPLPDAPPPPPDATVLETCAGQTLPATADDPVVLAGTANTLSFSGLTPVGGIAITAFDSADTMLAMTTSSSAGGSVGDFSLSVATGAAPLDGYVRATGNGFVDVYVYPPVPVTAGQDNLTALMVSPSNFNLVNSTLLRETQSASNGWIGVAVLDDSGDAVAGAQVGTVPGAGAVHYNVVGTNGPFPDPDATETDTDGVAYLVNVPAGEVTVFATAPGLSLRPVVVNARPGVITMTAVVPCSYGTVAGAR
ncbi:MAG: hypothetical protein R2939_00505 [Kofleriaceae bacterium]